ncbi:hypothetical protein N0V90_009377 [Kalmusia sp. IMI 367209]|nr:hypothetical protein N0V90_009377 [Kalmusia sp. IMI 367209]
MASLFRDFSFDAPSRHLPQHCPERAVLNVSPTSTSPSPFPLPARLPTPPPCSINDLAQALNKQDLRVIVDPRYKASHEPLTPPDDVTFSHALPERPQLSLSTARLNSATLRMQRQAHVRMQSSSSHVKDIASLVEQMIQVGDQCNVCSRKSKPPSPVSSEEDEGVSMDYTPSAKEEIRSMLPFYRAGDRIDGSTRVTKRPRMRKSTCSMIVKRTSR